MTSGGFASFGAALMRSRWKSWITIENVMSKRKDRLVPVHPGDVLREDFMKPLGLSAYAVAKAIGVTPIAISEIIRRKRAVNAEMALKLGRLFNVSSSLNKDVAVECLVGETPTSATETVALPETEQHTAAFIFKMLSPELWMGIQADYDLELARNRSEA